MQKLQCSSTISTLGQAIPVTEMLKLRNFTAHGDIRLFSGVTHNKFLAPFNVLRIKEFLSDDENRQISQFCA
jgi:hypothetical protein